jgi:uncharacterized protein
MTPDDQTALLSLATLAIKAKITHTPLPRIHTPDGILAETRGCFVTLTNGPMLRGCIGTFQASAPLGETIVEMAAAACDDPRFLTNPITPDELPQLTIGVSVLSELTLTNDPASLCLGTDGIYITNGFASGCFLPEVAPECEMKTADEFLDTCCEHKAGLPAGAWKDPTTKVFLFTSEKFSKEPGCCGGSCH